MIQELTVLTKCKICRGIGIRFVRPTPYSDMELKRCYECNGKGWITEIKKPETDHKNPSPSP